ncbi:MAG: sulfatase-like hydrolase/transferase [Solobacterium sp.]|nr:sulfatase-like hydrolase/transferase [Solobacterium sp.]
MEKNGFFVQSALKCFIVAMVSEMLFRLFSFPVMFDLSLIRITLFSIAYALGLAGVCSLLPLKLGTAVVTICNWFLPVYAVFQLGYNGLLGHYISLKSAGQGTKVSEFVEPFLNCLKPEYILLFLAPLAITVWSFMIRTKRETRRFGVAFFLVLGLLVNMIGVITVHGAALDDLYNDPAYISKGFMEFGLNRFLIRDMTTVFRNTGGISVDENTEEEETEDPSIRKIDDSEWIETRDAEEDEVMSTIDTYLMGRPSTEFNDMTGIFEGKNYIYILVEALDYMAFDEELTPTLCRLMKEGWDFTNHYTPRYNCTTGDTGFITETSLIPDNAVCTENEYKDNAFPNGMFQQFVNAGYTTSAYHNWWDQYYERRTYYANEGCQVYLNYDDLPIKTLTGWQSDLELMKLAVPEFIHQDKFMAAIITSAMHYPYQKYSDLGTRYLSEINRVHPDYPDAVKSYLSKSMDFDASLEYLIDALDEEGKLEDTVIMFFNDHHPFEMDEEMIAEYSNTPFDRLEALNIDRGQWVIYNAGTPARKFDGVNSTFDILPTMFNLFNIEYDPRLYMGTDYFSEKEKVVFMPEGDWITDKGIYYMESGEFDGNADEEYINAVTRENQNMLNISKMIYRSDYFAAREFITKPVYENTAPSVLARRLAEQDALDVPDEINEDSD